MERGQELKGLGVGLVLGAAIGLALGILYAPKSGAETRYILKEQAQEAKEKAEEVIGMVKEKAGGVVEMVKEKAGTMHAKDCM
jgi:gas vesicle protein